MDSNRVREGFLAFFERHGHTRVASSSLVPGGDSSLLFTNAGMVQFKDVFLGREQRDYTRAVSSQRCVRAGGKHNDLENVGYTARHHVFFEMLGNFSFGDYFKEEAIGLAWELLTRDFDLPPQRLWVSIYHDDDDSERLWRAQPGLAAERIVRLGEEDNFWSMGTTGPCGPCTEVYYDHGERVAGGPPGSGVEGDRYVEIWNLVFTQFDRGEDGELTPIPRPSVDTGMGLERISAVLQGVHDNYDTDLFVPLLEAVRGMSAQAPQHDASMRVIADHVRAAAFLIADGVVPGNEGRAYVLRRIIRRAVRHGSRLGLADAFLYRLVATLVALMGAAWPQLKRAQGQIEQTLRQEEERFHQTLSLGLRHLEEVIGALSGASIPGEAVFRLYDTYGFPADLVVDVARERGLGVDMPGFERAMQQQRQRARRASRFGERAEEALPVSDAVTEFRGYDTLASTARVVALYRDGQPVARLAADERGAVVLDRTPFYAEGGGQVGDHGRLRAPGCRFAVEDTQASGQAHLHLGVMQQGELRVGAEVTAEVDAERRMDTVRNHSATHLLNAALRRVLGEGVTQQGSLVAPERLRFDFSHPRPLTDEQLATIEDMVNDVILGNVETLVRHMPMDRAMACGALALCGEKYGEEVRVLDIGGDFSRELCGGVHVQRSGDIGLFKIVAESGVAANVRRIEAVTGRGACRWASSAATCLQRMATRLGSSPDALEPQLERLLERLKQGEKEIDTLRSRLAGSVGGDLAAHAEEVAGTKVLAHRLDGADAKTLRRTVDQLKQRLGSAALVLASVADGKVRLVAGVTPDRMDSLPAQELANFVAGQVGGRGGGRADLAQAGGDHPEALGEALASVSAWVRERMAAGGRAGPAKPH